MRSDDTATRTPTAPNPVITPPRRRAGAIPAIIAIVAVLSLLAGVVVWGAIAGADADPAPAGPTPASSASAASGKTKYMTTCIACHGEHGEARPGLGKDLAHSDFLKGLSDKDAINFLKQGRMPSDPLNTTGVQMPPKGGNPALNDGDLADIVAYLRSLQAE